MTTSPPIYFSDYYRVGPDVLDQHGAFDLSVVSDLPVFIDPFLLFNSEKDEYQALHDGILRYLRFLRDIAAPQLDDGTIDALYRFPEVKQNWLGYCLFGNRGSGLGPKFARELHLALGDILSNFGDEEITKSSHLEKLTLVRPGVGKDNISDFTTNLITDFLCKYTQEFAKQHLDPSQCDNFAVGHAVFNYDTETWGPRTYYLPKLRKDFALLTPIDLLTREATWINYTDMVRQYPRLPPAVSNLEQRAKVQQYFKKRLGRAAKQKERDEAAAATIRAFPELIDQYIKLKEESGDRATKVSSGHLEEVRRRLIEQTTGLLKGLGADFLDKPWTSYEECRDRLKYFKDYIEKNDGYKLFNKKKGGFATEDEVQLAFGLVWCSTDFDINREANNGRGPVDWMASYGKGDKSLIEFKLGSNTQLKRGLTKQVEIYKAANKTDKAIKAIVFFTAAQERRVHKILTELGLDREPAIVLIDARSDNKPSASTAR